MKQNLKKVIAIILALALVGNLLLFATGNLEMTIFWINLLILYLIVHFAFGDNDKPKKKRK